MANGKMIISLTSFPARLPQIGKCLQSLIDQLELGDRLVLWLGNEKFPNRMADVPTNIRALSTDAGGPVEIRFTHDMKSFTKLLPALKTFPDDCIITVDDDTIYKPGTIALLKAAHRQNGTAIFAHGVSDVYRIGNRWKRTTGTFGFRRSPIHMRMPLGVCGVLYPPHSLHPQVHEELLFQKLTASNDDIWFWYCAVKQGTPVLRVPGAIQRQGWTAAGTIDALCAINEVNGDQVNRENILRLMDFDPAFADKLSEIANRNRFRTALSLAERFLIHYPRQILYCLRVGGWRFLHSQIKAV